MTGRARAIWVVGASVYLLAVFNRSTLGIAGPLAVTRFGITASQLGTFVMLQLAVYAALQIPAGLLIDRYGPRRMLLAAALLMAVGQLGFALSPDFALALISRGILGSGDALTYVSVLRLLAAWFPASRYALMASFTGFFGMAGNMLATVPLAALLPVVGWVPAFGGAAALCVLFAALLVKPGRVQAPYRPDPADAPTGPGGGRIRRLRHEVAATFAEPGERLGFWCHFAAMNAPMVFTVLWGYPYLTQVLGYSRTGASGVLLMMVLLQLALAVIIGAWVGRRVVVRVPIALTAVLAAVVALGLLIGWPGGQPPPAVVITAAVLLSLGTPASGIAFLLARDYNPEHRMSTATGLANTGGWTATVLGVLGVGIVLDLVDHGEGATATGYRWAFALVLAITVFGMWRMLVWWRRLRGQLLELQAAGKSGPAVVLAHWFDQGVR